MRIINPDLLRRYSGAGICDLCGKRVRNRHGHHIFHRGLGGGFQIDLAINILSACETFAGGDHCHALIHAAKLTISGRRATRDDLLMIVAQRERTTVDDIVAVIHMLRRLPKGSSAERIEEAIRELDASAAELARRELREAKVLAA